MRLVQVREAQKRVSQKILAENRFRKEKSVQELGQKLLKEWEEEQISKIEKADKALETARQDQGKAQKNVAIDVKNQQFLQRKRADDKARAKVRGRTAEDIIIEEQMRKNEAELKLELKRLQVQEMEIERAKMIAELGRKKVEKEVEDEEPRVEPPKATRLQRKENLLISSEFIIPEGIGQNLKKNRLLKIKK